MNKALECLIELQEIDTRLNEIDEIKGDLPEKVQRLTKEIETLTDENSTSTARVAELDKSVRQLSAEIDDNAGKLKRYKEQLYLVTSNKEYDALLKEIDVVKSSITESEDQIISHEEEKTNLDDRIKSNEIKIETAQGKLQSSQAELNTALEETEAEEKQLIENRKKASAAVDPPILTNYERFLTARDGLGMTALNRGACGNCYYSLPPQTIIEIKRRDRFMNCPSCGIYIYSDGTEDL